MIRPFTYEKMWIIVGTEQSKFIDSLSVFLSISFVYLYFTYEI